MGGKNGAAPRVRAWQSALARFHLRGDCAQIVDRIRDARMIQLEGPRIEFRCGQEFSERLTSAGSARGGRPKESSIQVVRRVASGVHDSGV
jgi:hypothetical protein